MYTTLDRSLPEAILALQRPEFPPETIHLADEAARLLGEGREIEARAVIEKAQALVALRGPAPVAGNGKTNGNGGGTDGSTHQQEDGVDEIASRLGARISSALTSAVQELGRYSGNQARTLTDALAKRLDAVEAALANLAGLPEQVAQTAAEQANVNSLMETRCEVLAGEIGLLQQADQEGRAELARVGGRTDELAQAIAAGLDSLAGRLSGHEERLAELDRLGQSLHAGLAQAIERLDRQADALRGMQQRQQHRSAVLNELFGAISKLREHGPGDATGDGDSL